MRRVLAKRRVHAVARAPQCAQGRRRHALEIDALLQQLEAFEQGARMSFEYGRIAGSEHVAGCLAQGDGLFQGDKPGSE